MTGVICGIKRMEIHDGDGLRTTVFFKGCSLKCVWCHNPESIAFSEQTAFFSDKCIGCGGCKGERNAKTAEICPTGAIVHYGQSYEAEKLAALLLKDKQFFDASGGGVTFSGGECLMQIDFAVEVAKILKANGVGVYIDTCGHVPRESIEKILPYADKFLYDIKAVNTEIHKKCTGKDNSLILDNLRFLSVMGAIIEVRYPYVKGMNGGEADGIGRLLSGLKGISGVKVLRYHDLAASRYRALGMENTLPENITEIDDVREAERIIASYGLSIIK